MAEELLTAGPGAEFQSGLYPSVDPLSAPFWTQGQNVDFRKGGVVTTVGYTQLFDVTQEIIEMVQGYVPGEQRVYAATLNADGELEVLMYDPVGGLTSLGTFTTPGDPSMETWGSWLLVSTGLTSIRLWKNTGTLTAIGSLPFTFAKIIKRKNNHILAFNTSNGDNAYEWSTDSDVETWTPLSSNAAGSNWIRDLDSEIVAVADLGDALAVYSRRSMALVNWQGQPFVFGHRLALTGIGAVSKRSVVSVGAQNFGLMQQGIFVTDGTGFQFVDKPAVHDLVVEGIDWTKANEIRGYHNEKLTTVFWFYTDLEGERKYIGLNYQDLGFVTGALPVILATPRQVFQHPIGAVGTNLVLMDDTQNAGTEPLEKWIRTKPQSAGDARRQKIWAGFKVVGKWEGARFRAAVLDDPHAEPTSWFAEGDLEFTNWFPDGGAEGTFLVLEFQASGLDESFAISQLQLLGVPTGEVSL